ncbi:2-hydroxychromene-2-carboxylate isomerase [Micromonospora sp. CP22]|uniref:2-hydroxychromene-2-carboxylate isomerase n=1 Tax=Micromonospora sp. CP22 TaxID=2580517 RepID=UPI0012BC3640|nr:DsbA family protein [Micromonospora sp. CP22]MTK01492.1 disulfide bond formation protein DsbA [Micromonospora sp. CP22]
MTRRARLYFSFRSPYSWLTVRRLRAAVPDAFDALDWLPYWDPDGTTAGLLAERGVDLHYGQMSRSKHRYILLDTKRLATADGAAMAWPVDVDPWWEPAHLAWLWARRSGRAEPFYDAVTAARWERGENISDPAVVAACAAQAGLDPDVAAACADDPELRAEGVECLSHAYHDDVFGVPYLKLGHHRFWGYDRLDAFLATWPRPTEPPSPPPVTTAYDADTAGGCG